MPRALARLLAIIEGRPCGDLICVEMDLAGDPADPVFTTPFDVAKSLPLEIDVSSFLACGSGLSLVFADLRAAPSDFDLMI